MGKQKRACEGAGTKERTVTCPRGLCAGVGPCQTFARWLGLWGKTLEVLYCGFAGIQSTALMCSDH